MLARRCVAFVFPWAFLLVGLAASAQDVQPDQTIALLVTTAPGAPTADELVAYYQGQQLGPPPLQGLTVGNPQKIVYLMSVRAQGDFLANLQAHPDSTRAALERYVVVMYPAGTDRSAPLAALRADPYVLAAYPTPASDFSTPATSVSAKPLWAPDAPEAPTTDPQYGRADMNVDAAWQMAGGYALIADIDSGLYEQSAALMQFNAAGHYLGGGFVPVHSMDISLTGLVDGQNSDDVDERRPMPVTNSACNPDPQNQPNMQPTIAGHGTHVTGLMIADGDAGLGVRGTCKRCGVGNRATPLFRLHSPGAKDYADTTSPQMAIGMMINSTHAWQPVASLPLVPNYPNFPHDPADGAQPPPRASVYVLTTEYKPRSEWPALVPLYLMDKDFPDAYRDVDDFMLVTTTADIEYAHDHGYNLRTIQGYIYAPCTAEPNCIPPGAQKFYRACNAAANDCATFLESESAMFAASGYSTTFPPIAGTKTLLGYAYPAADTDGDGLPDGFEYVVGTNPLVPDSDADGLADAYEYPMVGVPFGDPCAGGIGAKNCGADVIFKDGFEFP